MNVLTKLFLAFTLAGAAPAWAGVCGLSIVANDIVADWDLTWTTQAVQLSVSKTNPAACTFGLGFSKGGAGSYTRYASNGGKQLRYQLYQDSSVSKILKDVPDVTTSNDVLMVTLPAGANPTTVLYYFDIPYSSATTPTLAAAGAFTDTFIVNAYEGSDPATLASPPDASAQVNVTANVPKITGVALVDTGGVFSDSATTKTINFGNLYQGQVSRFEMRIQANAGYSVTTASSNSGRLKHVSKNSYVSYKLYVNNVESDPAGVTPVLTGSGQTSLSGLGYPVKIVIGTVGALALAGQYQDTVTITVTATE